MRSLHACMLSRFSRVWLCATLGTAAHQAPLSTGFCRQEYWSGLPFPSPNEVFRRLCFSHILTLKGLDNSETTKVKHRVNNFPATQGGSNTSLVRHSFLSPVSWWLCKEERFETCLVVQWLRTRPPVQETQFQSLVRGLRSQAPQQKPSATYKWGGGGERWIRQTFALVYRQGTWEVKQVDPHELAKGSWWESCSGVFRHGSWWHTSHHSPLIAWKDMKPKLIRGFWGESWGPDSPSMGFRPWASSFQAVHTLSPKGSSSGSLSPVTQGAAC